MVNGKGSDLTGSEVVSSWTGYTVSVCRESEFEKKEQFSDKMFR